MTLNKSEGWALFAHECSFMRLWLYLFMYLSIRWF